MIVMMMMNSRNRNRCWRGADDKGGGGADAAIMEGAGSCPAWQGRARQSKAARASQANSWHEKKREIEICVCNCVNAAPNNLGYDLIHCYNWSQRWCCLTSAVSFV
jgi:hypothetical protein